MSKPFVALPLLASLLSVAACSTSPPAADAIAAAPALRTGELRDFSGHWEKNYQLSDDFNTRFSLYAADIRRLLARLNQGDLEGLPALRGRGINTDAISGLARFTEELTRMPLLEIAQDDVEIEIERENDFTLRCAYADLQFVRSTNTFGSDVCGWTDERLQFQMALGGGLTISHQFSLSADASLLNVTTTVSSDDISVPLIISNYYQRYLPSGEDYNCILTLTRNTVCNQQGTPQ
ncbi:MAG: hypothetical protein RLZZ227_2808 [Pseudomonadota bacterium]|jgi:hypothetical protein